MGSRAKRRQRFMDRNGYGVAGESLGLGHWRLAGTERKVRATRIAAALAVSAAVTALNAAPSVSAAAVPAVPGPATVLTVFPWEGSMADELQGSLCRSPNTCRRVDQSLWDPDGLATIDAAIDTTPGIKVVFSYSEGARSVTSWLIEHADDADAPSADELSFVVIGNPTRRYGGSDSDVMPQTQYQVIDVSRQYDMASDFPDYPLNLLALLNSLAAFTVIHTEYEDVDMYDDANIVWKEGNITYVFVPTKNLPLLEPLRQLGLTDLADALNEPLKKIVERGYDRSYLPTPIGEPATPPAPSAAPDQAARVVEQTFDPRDADRADSGTIDSTAGPSASAADDDTLVEERSPAGARKTTKQSLREEEAAASSDDAESLDADTTSEDDDGDRAAMNADNETGDATAVADDGDSSTADNDSGDSAA